MKISEMTYTGILNNDDLIEIAKKNGSSYETKSTSLGDISAFVKESIKVSDCISSLVTSVVWTEPPDAKEGDILGRRDSELEEYKFYICTKID